MLDNYRFTLRLVDELRWILAQFIQQFFQFAHSVSRIGDERRRLAETTIDKLLHVAIMFGQPVVHTRADIGQIVAGLVESSYRRQKIRLCLVQRCPQLADRRFDLFED